MYLSKLYIKNYKSINETEINFTPGKNIIVGRNNSGKSNVISALDLVLGENSPTWEKSTNILDNHFHKGNTDNPIFIGCELTKCDKEVFNFDSVKSSAFFTILENNEEMKIHIPHFKSVTNLKKLIFFNTEDGTAKLEDNSSGYRKNWIGGKSYCKDSFEDEFINTNKILLTFYAEVIEGKICKYLGFYYSSDAGVSWKIGVGGEKLRNIFLQSAVIPAFRDPQNQLRISDWTWYGKLLKNYIISTKELDIAFKQVKNASDKVFESLKSSVCDAKIDIAFPNTKVSFQFNPDTKQDIYKNALIYVDDGFNSNISEKGSGIQSAVIIGLFDFYIQNVVHANNSLLAIEEPELYLHPHGRRVISNRLDTFLNNGKNQVIITTHSEEFIVPLSDLLNIIVVRKDANQGTAAYNQDFDNPKEKQILIKKENAEIFFADAVILVEDLKYFLEELAKEYGEKKLIGKNWLNNYNISVINVGGKAWFWKYRNILEKKLQIPVFTLADFDYFRDSEIKKEIDDESLDIDTVKSKVGKENLGKLSSVPFIYVEEMKTIIGKLKTEKKINLISTGDLESLYKTNKKPRTTKEQGIIETIGSLLETGGKISDYILTEDLYIFFDTVIDKLKISNQLEQKDVNTDVANT